MFYFSRVAWQNGKQNIAADQSGSIVISLVLLKQRNAHMLSDQKRQSPSTKSYFETMFSMKKEN